MNEVLRVTDSHTEPKVDDLDLLCPLYIKEDIVHLQIPVCVAFRVHIGDPAYYLPENLFAGRLRKSLVWLLLDMVVYAHALA